MCAVKFDEMPQIVSYETHPHAGAQRQKRTHGERRVKKSQQRVRPSAQPSNIKYERAEMCPLMNLLRPNNQLFKSVFVEDIKTNSVAAPRVSYSVHVSPFIRLKSLSSKNIVRPVRFCARPRATANPIHIYNKSKTFCALIQF